MLHIMLCSFFIYMYICLLDYEGSCLALETSWIFPQNWRNFVSINWRTMPLTWATLIMYLPGHHQANHAVKETPGLDKPDDCRLTSTNIHCFIKYKNSVINWQVKHTRMVMHNTSLGISLKYEAKMNYQQSSVIMIHSVVQLFNIPVNCID